MLAPERGRNIYAGCTLGDDDESKQLFKEFHCVVQDESLADLKQAKQAVAAAQAALAAAAAVTAAQSQDAIPSNGRDPVKGRSRLCRRPPSTGTSTQPSQSWQGIDANNGQGVSAAPTVTMPGWQSHD